MDFPWSIGVFDAHCHPTDIMHSISLIPQMKTRGLTVMSTRAQDQELVAQTASSLAINSLTDLREEKSNHRVIPCFGWHPWFSHMMYDDTNMAMNLEDENFKIKHYQSVLTPMPEDFEFLKNLPTPRSITSFLAETRKYLEAFPCALVGEIGLDKSFRLPCNDQSGKDTSQTEGLTPGTSEGHSLSRYHVDMHHQKAIFKAQLNLAGKMGRPVSVHGVQAHGVVFDTLRETWKDFENESKSSIKKRRLHLSPCDRASQTQNLPSSFPPRICLHAYSGPKELLKQYLHSMVPAEVYFSFSTIINMSNTKAIDVIKIVPDDRILAESDFHQAGEKMDHLLEQVCREICKIKGWELQDGVAKLSSNWRRFVFS